MNNIKLFIFLFSFLTLILYFDIFNLEKFDIKKVHWLEKELELVSNQLEEFKTLKKLSPELINNVDSNQKIYYRLGAVCVVILIGGLFFYCGSSGSGNIGGMENVISPSIRNLNPASPDSIIFGDTLQGPSIESYKSYTPPGSPSISV